MIFLDGAQRTEVVDALLEAFDIDNLERLVAESLAARLNEVAGARDLKVRIWQVLELAEAKDGVADLLRAAIKMQPRHTGLRRVAEQLGLAPPTDALAAVVGKLVPIENWMPRLLEVTEQVCLIVTPRGWRTGFLVGPDQVMSLADDLVGDGGDLQFLGRAQTTPGTVSVRFEADASKAEAASSYQLETRAPLVYFSVTSRLVVLRLDRPGGRDSGGANRARGFTTLDDAGRLPPPGGPLVLIKYDGNGQRMVSVDTHGFIEARAGGAELRYRNATSSASMGAPIFDLDLRLVGVHRATDPEARNNRGVAIAPLLEEMRATGFHWTASEGLVRAAVAEPVAADLDARVRAFTWTAEDDADAWTAEDADAIASAADRWAWAEAAAPLATFDAARLVPIREASASARTALLLESRRASRPGRWCINDRLRRRALERLAKRGELRGARAMNAASSDPADPTDVLLAAAIEGRATATLPTKLDELRVALKVATWLDGLVAGLPTVLALRAATERASLLSPFAHLTTGPLFGRERELRDLHAYVDGHTEGVRLPFLYGPGGMGKSALLARLIVEHAQPPTGSGPGTPSRLFAYVDFDQPAIEASHVETIYRSIVRQVALQVPEHAAAAEALLDDWAGDRDLVRRTSKRAQRVRPGLDAGARVRLTDAIASFLRKAGATAKCRLLLVLDTMEEAQYATPDAVLPLIRAVADVANRATGVRPIFAGRVRVDGGDELLATIELTPLDRPAAESLLRAQFVANEGPGPAVIAKAVSIYGGNPLSLKLVADALRREKDVESSKLLGEDDDLWKRVGDAVLHGRLYERILGHVHSPEVQRIANPGLALRRVTWEVVRDVLAGPCELPIANDEEARRIFDELAAESALVRQGDDPAVLELRPELRRALLEDLANDGDGALRRSAIHVSAIAFYASRGEISDRAEELYHRLMLDQDPVEVDRRWVVAAGPSLRASLDELPERGRAYVANRLGIVDDASLSPAASPIEWEEWAEKRGRTLLELGEPDRALQVLRLRADRLQTSRLHLLESIALRTMREPNLDAALRASAHAVDAARQSKNADDIRAALEEQLDVARAGDDDPVVLRVLAELGNLGEQLGDDLILLQSTLEALEAFVDQPSPAQFSTRAVGVFGRLADELVTRAPELARRVAAQVAGRDPATLQRVLRLVGVGRVDDEDATSLYELLRGWAQDEPAIASFVPSEDAPAAEVCKALEYLVTSRTLDPTRARSIGEWLATVVTPKRRRAGGQREAREGRHG